MQGEFAAKRRIGKVASDEDAVISSLRVCWPSPC